MRVSIESSTYKDISGDAELGVSFETKMLDAVKLAGYVAFHKFYEELSYSVISVMEGCYIYLESDLSPDLHCHLGAPTGHFTTLTSLWKFFVTLLMCCPAKGGSETL